MGRPCGGRSGRAQASRAAPAAPWPPAAWGRAGALAAALTLTLTLTLGAEPAAAARDPQACLALIDRDATLAAEEARAWAREGGGGPAAICEALAMEALGAFATAALRLEQLAAAEGEGYGPAERAAFYEIAGGWRLQAGQPAAARAALDSGVALDRGGAALRRLRAEALAELGESEAAIADLNVALAAEAGDVDARLLRARLRREAGAPEGALNDAAQAAEAAPERAGAWLEKGAAEAALGRKPEARESLLRAISLDRDGPAGAEAQAVLQRMELGG